MTEIVLFTPKADCDAAENLDGFVEMCRSKLTVFGADLPFKENVWDVTDAIQTKGMGGKRTRITFSSAATVDEKMPKMLREPFLSFAKAYVRYMHGMRPSKVIYFRIAALRAIEAALLERGTAPNPVQIDAHVLNRAAQNISDWLGEDAAYRVGGQIEMIGAFLLESRLTTFPVRWRNPIKRTNSGVRIGKEFDRRRMEKMPSLAALNALPKIFRLATEPADVIVTSVAALLLSSPDRISEALSLPEECEVREPRGDGEISYGLRWWPAKGAEPMVKWLVPSMAAVVQEALQRIRVITKEARKIAKWYESNPDRIYLAQDADHLRDREWLTMEDVVEILGLTKSSSAQAWCKANAVKTRQLEGNGSRVFAHFSDVEAAVLAMLPKGFPIFDKETGLKYSEALFVVRRHELGAQRSTLRPTIETISISQINTGLGSRAMHGFASVFSRHGFTEPDATPIVVTSHQFRHYLNTLAQAGGLSQLDIAKWSGRKDVRQNEAYDHVTPDQMLRKIRGSVGTDQMFGLLAELPKKVPISRDEFARLIIPTAHTTDLGYCVHDYTATPCQLHMDCIHCQDFVCVKGDIEKEARLRHRLDEAKELMAKSQAAVADGYFGSDRWLDHHLSTLERLTQLSSIIDNPEVPNGTVIQLSPPKTLSRIDHETGGGHRRLDKGQQARLPSDVKALLGN